MNIFLNEYPGFCFELNFELNHILSRFNEKMKFQNGSARACPHTVFFDDPPYSFIEQLYHLNGNLK